jgi:hypothetical protein
MYHGPGHEPRVEMRLVRTGTNAILRPYVSTAQQPRMESNRTKKLANLRVLVTTPPTVLVAN